jgi:hypothetical protein
MNKRALNRVLTATTIEVALVFTSVTQPSDCGSCEPSIAPIPTGFPLPDGRPPMPQILTERVRSGASAGGVVVEVGVGELMLEGLAPTLSVSC